MAIDFCSESRTNNLYQIFFFQDFGLRQHYHVCSLHLYAKCHTPSTALWDKIGHFL